MADYLQMNIPRSKNLLRLIIVLPAGIFFSEVLAMVLVFFYKGPYLITILIDAVITTILMLPLIYLLSYRPLLNHIAEQDRAESIMEVRLKLVQFAAEHSMDELLQTALDEIETLTGSTIGFFHFLEADQKTLLFQSWSTNTLKYMCNEDGKGGHYDIDQAGVWADCIRQRRPVIHNNYASLKHRKGIPDGHALIVREMTVPVLRNGQVVAIFGVGNKPQNYIADDTELVSTLADFAWDIIERKRAEDAMRASEEKFRTLVDWTYDCEQWIDPQGNIVYISPSCERITGWLPGEFVADHDLLVRIVHPDDRQAYEEHRTLIHDETAGINNLEYRIIARDGSERWIDHICRPLFGDDNSYRGRRVSNRDITVRKQTEQELVERNKKEIFLTQTIHNMQLEIARDLHDTIGQNVSYLRMKLDYLSELDSQIPCDLNVEIESMFKAADESYDLIRGTLAVLQSGDSDDPLSLFTRYANQVGARSDFEVNIISNGVAGSLSSYKMRQLFFVFREALSNIEKYSHADQVLVEFKWDQNNLDLEIMDNGVGFDLKAVNQEHHYGLKFMKERVQLLDGTFTIQSDVGKGTKVMVRVSCLDELLITI